MKARAPGKVVLSGAYAVLHGAPGVVSAVTRCVIADSSRPATMITAEVATAIEHGTLKEPLFFDASSLRENGRKLGLGSSAAILVATLAASRHESLNDPDVLQQLFLDAYQAHRAAQQGGSGIDVAASVHGGTLVYQMPAVPAGSALQNGPAPPRCEQIQLPRALHAEVWAAPREANTRTMLARVDAWRCADPLDHDALMGDLGEASRSAVEACHNDDEDQWLSSLARQFEGFVALGAAAGISICTDSVRRLNDLARQENGLVFPAGAGGGDICVFFGRTHPSPALRQLCTELGHQQLTLSLAAPGVVRFDEPETPPP